METIITSIPPEFTAERQRQIEHDGWDDRHAGQQANGELLAAAVLYYQRAIGCAIPMREVVTREASPCENLERETKLVPAGWPWDERWWKPGTPLQDVRLSGALCLAEINRLKSLGAHRSVATVEHQLKLIIDTFNALTAS